MMPTFPGVATSNVHMRTLSAAPHTCWCVILAADAARAIPETFDVPGAHAIIAHDVGVRWPDRGGVALVRATLANGGAAALGFATLADALAAKRRLDAEAGQ